MAQNLGLIFLYRQLRSGWIQDTVSGDGGRWQGLAHIALWRELGASRRRALGVWAAPG